jgi:hypothetical protein
MQRGQQPGTYRGRLADTGAAHHRDQPRPDEAGDQLRHQPLAPEEVRGVADVERGETLVRETTHGRPA